MVIGGLQKLTLIDYPGKIAATVFTASCNFRCPFCHNPELVLADWSDQGAIKEKDFFDFLKNRKGKLEGVCLTGGEPTLQPDILKFITKIKKLGLEVKLDTNGLRTDVLKSIISEQLVDYIAMDIKNSIQNYEKACGIKLDKERIELSVDLIMNSRIDYEFRTTVVPGIHTEKDFVEIGQWINGAEKYVLQRYEDQGKILNERLRKKAGKSQKIDLEKIRKRLRKNIKQVDIRE
jgi:pyruvate formate lyase activating enzyme